MKSDIDTYYLEQKEPQKSVLLALRHIILNHNPDISEAWKYRMPFFLYRKNIFCYVWTNKKTREPYIGFMDGYKINHKKLIIGERARVKILLINSKKDLPVNIIRKILILSCKLRVNSKE